MVKTEAEIELIRQSSLLLGKTHAEVAKHIRPGVTTRQLDKIAEDFIRSHNALPSFKGYGGFPATLCTSVNEVVVHGFPNDIPLKEGDIVSIDCGVYMNGYHGDSAYTYPVGEISEDLMNLLKRTKQSLYFGIEKAVHGKRTGDIGHAVQSYSESFGYGVVRDLVGHGVGKNLHEKPDVPNYGRKGTGHKLESGMTIAIEPMITLGKRHIDIDNDGWTIRTIDGKAAAHYEHTVAIRKDKAEILTTFEFIEEELKKHGIVI